MKKLLLIPILFLLVGCGAEEKYQEGLQDGETIGFSNGYEAGKTEGYHEGRDVGITIDSTEEYKRGYNEGYDAGISDSQNHLFGL